MLATYIPDRITVYDPEHLAAELRSAIISVTGNAVGDPAICVLMAQIALETGRGKACHGFNYGNIKCAADYEGHYSCFRCNEIIHGKVEWFSPTTGGYGLPPGHPQTRFRAYPDADRAKGALEYVAFLARPGSRYHSAWLKALQGDAAGYVHELKRHGYFTADEARYRLGVVSLVNTYKKAVYDSHALDHPALGHVDHQVHDETARLPLTDEDIGDRLQQLQTEPDWDAMQNERDENIEENS